MKEGPLREAMVFKTVVSLLRDHSEDVAVQSGGLQALAHLLRHGVCVWGGGGGGGERVHACDIEMTFPL